MLIAAIAKAFRNPDKPLHPTTNNNSYSQVSDLANQPLTTNTGHPAANNQQHTANPIGSTTNHQHTINPLGGTNHQGANPTTTPVAPTQYAATPVANTQYTTTPIHHTTGNHGAPQLSPYPGRGSADAGGPPKRGFFQKLGCFR
ncbi:hypothetical protein MMC12_001157 [Toensbergia leucococca]|nr:hypothetical protein [Toensbergia leucococca]